MFERQPKKNQEGSLEIPGIDIEAVREALAQNKDKKWLSYSIPIPEIDPLAFAEQYPDEDNLYYWEQPQKQFAIVAGGVAEILKATGPYRFDQIGEQFRVLKKKLITVSSIRHTLTNPVLVGGYSFSDHNVQSLWKKFGAARFQLSNWTIIKSARLVLLTLTVSVANREISEVLEDLQQTRADIIKRWKSVKKTSHTDISVAVDNYRVKQPKNSFSDWRKQVMQCRDMIARGSFNKIVIARQLDFETEKHIQVSRAMYHLRRQFPECYNFMIKVDGGPIFIGATPERLIAIRKNRILTESLAGSISRGVSASEDVALGHTLMESLKERSEHNYVVEEISKNLRKYSHRVEHPHEPVIKKLQNVQHLYTPISAEIDKNTTIHEMAGLLHPTPAVGGFPRPAAVPYINEIEKMDRGWYAGPIGWFNISGSGEFAVAIRSALVDKNRARLYAGCGIVKNSDPATEWQETYLKFSPVFEALKHAANHP